MPPPLTLTFSCGAPVSFIQASTTDANASLHSKRSMSSIASPVFSSACLVARIGPVSIQTGSSPRTERWWIRARGVSPWSATACSEAISIAEDASQIWRGDGGGDPAARGQRLEAGHLLQRGLARALVGVEARPVRQGDRLDLVARTGPRRSRPAPGRARPARTPPSPRGEMSHFSAIISAERNWLTSWSPYRAQPAGRLRERRREAVLLADQHRGGDRDRAHVLHAAGDDEVLGAGHHALRGEVHRLLRRAALPVDGHAGHVVGQPGHQPRRAGDVAGLRADRVAAAEDHVVDGARVDAGTAHQRGQRVRGEVGGVHRGERAAALADRGADGVDDVGLRSCGDPVEEDGEVLVGDVGRG